MNPIELKGTRSDGKEVYAHACGKCGYTAVDQAAAERCCQPAICACGAECEKGWTACKACRDSNYAGARKKAFEQATKIQAADYKDWLFCECCERFYESVDDLIDYHCDRNECPTWAWACTSRRLSLDAYEIILSEIERQECFDDAGDYIPDLAALQAELDAVGTEIPPIWEPDYSHVVTFEAEAASAAAELAAGQIPEVL
jgi:hypothetical protein